MAIRTPDQSVPPEALLLHHRLDTSTVSSRPRDVAVVTSDIAAGFTSPPILKASSAPIASTVKLLYTALDLCTTLLAHCRMAVVAESLVTRLAEFVPLALDSNKVAAHALSGHEKEEELKVSREIGELERLEFCLHS